LHATECTGTGNKTIHKKNKITNPMTSKLTPVKKTHKENTQKETKPNQQA